MIEGDSTADLFVSHADADREWVAGYLLPALGLPAERVLTKDQFRPGAAVVEEFEHAVRDSRFSAVVLTPAYLTDEWSVFGEQLASHAAVADGRDRLVPVLLKPCRVPLHVEFRVRLDFTDAARWDTQSGRLRELLDRPEPPPERTPRPAPASKPGGGEAGTTPDGRRRRRRGGRRRPRAGPGPAPEAQGAD